MPSELGFPRYPQVTETTQDGFTRLRSWVRVPQRPPCDVGREERGHRNGGKRAAQGQSGTAAPAGGTARGPRPGKRRGGGAGRRGLRLGCPTPALRWHSSHRGTPHAVSDKSAAPRSCEQGQGRRLPSHATPCTTLRAPNHEIARLLPRRMEIRSRTSCTVVVPAGARARETSCATGERDLTACKSGTRHLARVGRGEVTPAVAAVSLLLGGGDEGDGFGGADDVVGPDRDRSYSRRRSGSERVSYASWISRNSALFPPRSGCT